MIELYQLNSILGENQGGFPGEANNENLRSCGCRKLRRETKCGIIRQRDVSDIFTAGLPSG